MRARARSTTNLFAVFFAASKAQTISSSFCDYFLRFLKKKKKCRRIAILPLFGVSFGVCIIYYGNGIWIADYIQFLFFIFGNFLCRRFCVESVSWVCRHHVRCTKKIEQNWVVEGENKRKQNQKYWCCPLVHSVFCSFLLFVVGREHFNVVVAIDDEVVAFELVSETVLTREIKIVEWRATDRPANRAIIYCI